MEEKERFEILLEHIAKDVRTVAEGHISLNQKIDRNHEEARQERESIKQQMGIYVKTLSKKIEQVDQKVEINREEIVRNGGNIKEIDNKLSTNLENHEDRIKVLEVIN